MKLLLTATGMGNAFNDLTRAARGYVPSQLRLMDAAVRFTIQLAIDAAERDQGHARDLERTLIAKLSTWIDTDGEVTLRLWTHDMCCVIGALTRAAYHYAHPKGVVKHVMKTLSKNLTVAAVAFTIQLVLEETELPAVAMRGLERELIRKLEEPWEIGEIPLSVDVQDGPTWGSIPEKELGTR